MWALLQRKTQILVLVAMTVVTLLGVQGVSELWMGELPPLGRLISMIAFVIGTGALAFANWGWRWLWRKFPILNKVFFPDLNGTWEGTLKSTWIDPKTEKGIAPIPSRLVIRQGILHFSIKQQTGESKSWSTHVIPEADPDADRYRIWYGYTNKPKMEFSHRSNDHDGIAWFEIEIDEDPDHLVGQYFTSRRTSGDMDFRRVG